MDYTNPLIEDGIKRRNQIRKALKEAEKKRQANAEYVESANEFPSFVVSPTIEDFTIEEDVIPRRRKPRFVEQDDANWKKL